MLEVSCFSHTHAPCWFLHSSENHVLMRVSNLTTALSSPVSSPTDDVSTAWEVTSLALDNPERSCCLCDYWVRVAVTPHMGGTSFRIGFQGANNDYLLSSITIGIADDSAASPPSTSLRTTLPVGGVTSGNINFPAQTRTYTDWVEMDVAAGETYVVEFFHV